jgi:hypothetical protein
MCNSATDRKDPKQLPKVTAKYKLEAAKMSIGREKNNGKGTFGGE